MIYFYSKNNDTYRQKHGLDIKSAPVFINKRAFIDNNAIILPGIEIGEKAIVEEGAFVTKTVEDGCCWRCACEGD